MDFTPTFFFRRKLCPAVRLLLSAERWGLYPLRSGKRSGYLPLAAVVISEKHDRVGEASTWPLALRALTRVATPLITRTKCGAWLLRDLSGKSGQSAQELE